jgi:hypothetical protein
MENLAQDQKIDAMRRVNVQRHMEDLAQQPDIDIVLGQSLQESLAQLFGEIDDLDRQSAIQQNGIEDAITSGIDARTLIATLADTELILRLKREEAQDIYAQLSRLNNNNPPPSRLEPPPPPPPNGALS